MFRDLFSQSPDENAAPLNGGGIGDGGVNVWSAMLNRTNILSFSDPVVDPNITLVGIVRFHRIGQIVLDTPADEMEPATLGSGIHAISFAKQDRSVPGMRLPEMADGSHRNR